MNMNLQTVNYLLNNTRIQVNTLNPNGFTSLDILVHGLRDYGDMDIGEALRGSGAMRAMNPNSSYHHPQIPQPNSEELADHHTESKGKEN